MQRGVTGTTRHEKSPAETTTFLSRHDRLLAAYCFRAGSTFRQAWPLARPLPRFFDSTLTVLLARLLAARAPTRCSRLDAATAHSSTPTKSSFSDLKQGEQRDAPHPHHRPLEVLRYNYHHLLLLLKPWAAPQLGAAPLVISPFSIPFVLILNTTNAQPLVYKPGILPTWKFQVGSFQV
eukprot:GHVU01034935.1.p1 GENE.GHVU01034935.1~~GHVU01034935.1.p1  ORF type:complete len:179 (-),score=13.57 GHVU01034935.1:32-568(-)